MPNIIPTEPTGYASWLTALKTTIRTARIKASLAVNSELVQLYWTLGTEILARQDTKGWGAKVVEKLAQDLRIEFPEMKGFSPRNLKYMRAFAEAWPDAGFVQQLVAQIPWGHNVRLLDMVPDRHTREWYVRATLEHGWSRSILEMQIEHQTHKRVGAAQTNFSRTLPAAQSNLARDIVKDPYAFDFLGLTDEVSEHKIETALIAHLQAFLIELGVGFAFVGRQYRLELDGDEFFVDLLFYHLKLHCYVVIELKNTDFKFEYTGQLNGYLAIVDEHVRDKNVDAPTIGIILCKSKKKTMVEYALRGVETPMGVSTFRTSPELPKELVGLLPSVEQLEERLKLDDGDAVME
jgi:predicted nuclease of restriction endonuclease-like (RecB) superfamily